METALGPAKSLSNGQTKPKFVVFFPVIKLQWIDMKNHVTAQ